MRVVRVMPVVTGHACRFRWPVALRRLWRRRFAT